MTGESERVLEQSGHSTKAMPRSVNCLRLMETTPENVHLGDLTVCTCSFAVSALSIVLCCPLSWTVFRSVPFTLAGK